MTPETLGTLAGFAVFGATVAALCHVGTLARAIQSAHRRRNAPRYRRTT